jgi:hypothetical protein
MRLRNHGYFGGFYYRVLLDDKTFSVNFIERTKGCCHDSMEDNHRCLKCLRAISWMDWTKNDTRCSGKCCCGQKVSLEIMAFEARAAVID